MNDILLLFGIALVGLGVFRMLRPRVRARYQPISEWFAVTFDDTQVTISAQPPGNPPWEQSFLWVDVIRICFKTSGLYASDDIYVFTSQRPESFVIPMEAKGGTEFWSKVMERGLFPPELAIKAVALPEGAPLCWPAFEDKP